MFFSEYDPPCMIWMEKNTSTQQDDDHNQTEKNVYFFMIRSLEVNIIECV